MLLEIRQKLLTIEVAKFYKPFSQNNGDKTLKKGFEA